MATLNAHQLLRRRLVLMVALVGCLVNTQAQGQAGEACDAEICVRPGEGKLIRIIIPAFKGFDPKLAEEMAQVLRRDLDISGIFEIVPAPPVGSALGGVLNEGFGATDFNAWATAGAEDFVKGEVRNAGASLDVDLRLYDANQSKQILLNYAKPAVTATNFRPAVHAFANAIIKYYTGVDGIFGQQMLIVRRNRSKGQSHVYWIGTDGEGLSQVSSGASINIMPGVGPGGSALYVGYGSGGPSLRSGGKEIVPDDAISRPDYCPGNGRIAVSLAVDENPEIYTMNADGSGRTRLTSNSYIDTSPSWSPDCSKIAFVSNRGGGPQIYVMSAGGGGATALTSGKISSYVASPAWSPQGDRVAFSARDDGNFDIFTIQADGSGVIERFTQNQGSNEDPTWSPDGNYIAFISDRSSGSGLYIMPARAMNSKQSLVAGGGGFAMPSWGY